MTKEIGAEDSRLSDEEIHTGMMGLISMTVINPWLLRNENDAYYKDQ
ncbi:hypothetical protein [Streptomyces massasporeus]